MSTNFKDRTLEVSSQKEVYFPGEIVRLTFEVVNEGEKNLIIRNNLDPKDGDLKIYLSQDGLNFREFKNSKWGLLETLKGNIVMAPKSAVRSHAEILWNWQPESLEFAFPNSGEYYLKAGYYVFFRGKTSPVLLESQPIKIIIEDPIGEDLKAWSRIRANGEIAYFLQEGDIHIPIYKTEEREKLKREIEQIVDQYPTSFYAESLRRSLDKFQEKEAKRQEAVRKMKQAEKP